VFAARKFANFPSLIHLDKLRFLLLEIQVEASAVCDCRRSLEEFENKPFEPNRSGIQAPGAIIRFFPIQIVELTFLPQVE